MDQNMDSHKSFLIKDLLGDVLRPGQAGKLGKIIFIIISN